MDSGTIRSLQDGLSELLGRGLPPFLAQGIEFVETGQQELDRPNRGRGPDGSSMPPDSDPLQSALAAGIPVSPDARRRSLDTLVRHAESLRAADAGPAERPSRVLAWLRRPRARLVPGLTMGGAAAFTLVFALRVTAGPGAAQPVRDALPGSFLHPAKLAGEQAYLSFLEITSGDEWCAIYERQLAAERVREIKLLLAAGARQRVQFEGFAQERSAAVAGIPVLWEPGRAPPAAGSYVRVLGLLEDGRVRVERAATAEPP